jgi:hypothetical protein
MAYMKSTLLGLLVLALLALSAAPARAQGDDGVAGSSCSGVVSSTTCSHIP